MIISKNYRVGFDVWKLISFLAIMIFTIILALTGADW